MLLQAMDRREHSGVSLSPKGHERVRDVNNIHQASRGAKRTLRIRHEALGGARERLSHESLVPQIYRASALTSC